MRDGAAQRLQLRVLDPGADARRHAGLLLLPACVDLVGRPHAQRRETRTALRRRPARRRDAGPGDERDARPAARDDHRRPCGGGVAPRADVAHAVRVELRDRLLQPFRAVVERLVVREADHVEAHRRDVGGDRRGRAVDDDLLGRLPAVGERHLERAEGDVGRPQLGERTANALRQVALRAQRSRRDRVAGRHDPEVRSATRAHAAPERTCATTRATASAAACTSVSATFSSAPLTPAPTRSSAPAP